MKTLTPIDRRDFVKRTGAGTVFASWMLMSRPAFAAGKSLSWPSASDVLKGNALQGSDINSAIDTIQSYRSFISLANNDALEDKCSKYAKATSDAASALRRLRTEYSGKLTNAQASAAIAVIATGVGTASVLGSLGVAAFAFATSPVWIGFAVGIGTVSVTWSLMQFENSSGSDRVVVGVSHIAGRSSLIAAADFVSDATKRIGTRLAALAIVADAYAAIKAGIDISTLSDQIEETEQGLEALGAQYRSFAGNPATCRREILAEIDATVTALEFIRDLGDLTLGAGPIILD